MAPNDTDVITRAGAFENRDAWTAEGNCRLERALELIGTRSALILLRELFYGAKHFDELASRTGLSEAVAERLKQLLADDLLTQRPYQEPGSRTRHEYVLTERGRSLFPILVALINWGDTLDDTPGRLHLTHTTCGQPLKTTVTCASGHEVPITETTATIAGAPRSTHPTATKAKP
ncbi:helix-turn-helix domain-containing protein [Kribbella sp. NPDC026611]|uniref:winged helix-turn-helix transcriptional regulator n=1 Tax=Kribbella sp. NPDC026611 TaxID=3154911 RepID=UPI00340570CF